jgi:hypothetical protein
MSGTEHVPFLWGAVDEEVKKALNVTLQNK